MPMAGTTRLTRAEQGQIRALLRTLRTSLTHIRDALMHFKSDRIDRDKLEAAARRVDDLMAMFSGDIRDSTQGLPWLAEIQAGVERVTNPKVADTLHEARVAITALLEVMRTAKEGAPAAVAPAPVR